MAAEHKIISIKEDRDRIRKRPTIYIPSTGPEGAIHIMYEVIDNSIDELISKGAKGNTVDIEYDTGTKLFKVVDDGGGIPLESFLDAMTVINTSGKFDNSDDSYFGYTAGLNGVGAKLNVFLSKYTKVTSKYKGKYTTYTFKDGVLDKTEEGTTKEHGVSTEFILDQNFVDVNGVKVSDIVDRLEEKSYLFPAIHLNITIKDKGKVKKTYKYFGKTIEDRVKQWKPDTPIYSFSDTRIQKVLKNITDDTLTDEKIIIDLSFAFKEDALDSNNPMEYIIAYGNVVKNYVGGTHVEGLKLGLQKFFKNEVKLRGKDKEINILPTDITNGLCCFIVCKLNDPEFRGQYKDQLSNQEVKFAVRDAVYDYLCNLKSTTPIVDFVKRVARGRMASKKTRKKDVSNAFSKDRLDKFKDIIQNLKTTDVELLLVEGDSAADNAAQARDPYNQAIYPIKRPANIFDQDTSSVEKLKTTFNDVLDICGLSVGDKCDPEKSTMNRILMLTDGDVDGDDIAISTVCLLAKHCKPLIDAGMVGRILPPAYAIPVGKGKKEYVRSQKEFFDWILKDFVKNHKVSFRGKEMSKKELRHFLEKNFNYDMEVDRLKDRYCCDPKFIEYLAWNYHGHQKDQKKSYWMNKLKPYPYLSIIMEKGDKGNILVIDGDYPGFDYLNLALDEYFDRHINRFKEMQKMNDTITGYTLDGKKNCTVYDVMHAMRSSIPGGKIERFKGLGELSPDEMRDLCMDKDKRTVAIFKFNDFKKDMDKINIMMSTKKEYVEARAKLIQSTTLDWKNLDT